MQAPDWSSLKFLQGEGEMARRIQSFDWEATALGAPDAWPAQLQTLIGVLIGSKQAMCLMWGPQQIFIYNDGYADILVSKHPDALGRPIREVWPEIWQDLKPIVDSTYQGQSTHIDDMAFTMMRKGYPEEAHFAFSFTPVLGPDGNVAGAFMPVVETTQRVIRERQATLEGERFSRLFEQSPTFMTVLRGPHHVFEYCNPGYMQLVGHRDVIGKPVAVAIPEAAGQGYFELLDRVYGSAEAFSATSMKIELQRSAGGPREERYLDFVFQPIIEADGTVSGIFVEGIDVTERARQDMALRASEEQLRLATEATNIGLWDYNFQTGDLFWQSAIRTMFGILTDGELKREDMLRQVHPDDRKRMMDALEATRDPTVRAPYDVEYRTIGRDDGRLRWVSSKGRAIFDEMGTCTRIVGTAIDITDRKTIEEELRRLTATLEQRVADAIAERNILADIVETTDIMVQMVDKDFNWLAVNRALADEFERVYGSRPVVGGNMLEALADLPEHQAAVKAIWSRALAGEEFTTVEEFGDPARARRAYEIKFSTLRDISGKAIGAYQFVQDVSERLENQARLTAAEEHLRQSQKMEAVGQLTGGIAHDFNNMLAVVLGSLELVARRIGEDDDRTKRQIDAATDAAKRAANLTERLLAFSRQQPLKPKVVDLNRLISNMADLLTHSLGADIQMDCTFAEGLWKIHADPNQLENVILNLSINARDAMPDGGRLKIETRNASLNGAYHPSAETAIAGDFVAIGISDTGSGMAPEVIAKAFEPFYTTKGVGKGTGLGLSQVYGFVKQSGGHCIIHSKVGEGTLIEIYLPRSDAQDEVEILPDIALPAGCDQDGTILVVDDEPAVRAFSTAALTELGYRVLEAENAEMALAVLSAHPEICLLFTDIVMPQTNGRQLAKQALVFRPDLKVLFTSGYAREAIVREDIVDPGVQLIGKPFSLSELGTQVRRLLDDPLAAS